MKNSLRTPWHDMKDSLCFRFGEEIGIFLAKRIGSDMRNKDCFTNFSIVDESDSSENLEKHRVRRIGCCGSLDRKIRHFKSNRTFLCGFNYGH